eukprot:15365842-Ditylum_brightwellii.AAC.1
MGAALALCCHPTPSPGTQSSAEALADSVRNRKRPQHHQQQPRQFIDTVSEEQFYFQEHSYSEYTHADGERIRHRSRQKSQEQSFTLPDTIHDPNPLDLQSTVAQELHQEDPYALTDSHNDDDDDRNRYREKLNTYDSQKSENGTANETHNTSSWSNSTIATQTNVTTAQIMPCAASLESTPPKDNTSTSYGSVFTLRTPPTNPGPINITSFDIYTVKTTNESDYFIYTKEGTYVDYISNASAWTLVVTNALMDNGVGVDITPTSISLLDFTIVEMMPNSTRSFYITLNTPDMYYSTGNSSEEESAPSEESSAVQMFTDELELFEGAVVNEFPFGSLYTEQSHFVGAVRYEGTFVSCLEGEGLLEATNGTLNSTEGDAPIIYNQSDTYNVTLNTTENYQGNATLNITGEDYWNTTFNGTEEESWLNPTPNNTENVTLDGTYNSTINATLNETAIEVPSDTLDATNNTNPALISLCNDNITTGHVSLAALLESLSSDAHTESEFTSSSKHIYTLCPGSYTSTILLPLKGFHYNIKIECASINPPCIFYGGGNYSQLQILGNGIERTHTVVI